MNRFRRFSSTTSQEATFDVLALPLTILGALAILGVLNLDPNRKVEVLIGFVFMLIAHSEFFSFKLSWKRSGYRPSSAFIAYAVFVMALGLVVMAVNIYGIFVLLGGSS